MTGPGPFFRTQSRPRFPPGSRRALTLAKGCGQTGMVLRIRERPLFPGTLTAGWQLPLIQGSYSGGRGIPEGAGEDRKPSLGEDGNLARVGLRAWPRSPGKLDLGGGQPHPPEASPGPRLQPSGAPYSPCWRPSAPLARCSFLARGFEPFLQGASSGRDCEPGWSGQAAGAGKTRAGGLRSRIGEGGTRSAALASLPQRRRENPA
ncbi:unnamed protein product [Rangifer tarandus platyrhynchus]|uniref:Uncharacterized protein n=1 Tax=Rangifer tarandus platyrhynchus TaxID=3082113 RepID=A0ABN8ZCB8_RANTA|nr:unnamed protein product [Rangifer tarandus platyrhynchus]CAI9688632.1 unnamed protein product [Rangifer tarandus platyrhynchus]